MTFHQLYYYVPESHLEITKEAIFAAGAGKMGNYSCCGIEHKVQGQYRPETGSCPYNGEQGVLSKASEYRFETVCDEKHIAAVIKALKKAHPYECPAYGVIKLENF